VQEMLVADIIRRCVSRNVFSILFENLRVVGDSTIKRSK